MDRLRLKICGMKKPENIRAVMSLRPDYMGFIFYPSSPRFVENLQLPADFPEAIERVTVVVDESHEVIVRQAEQVKSNTIQLHGHESVGVCRQLRNDGYKVIKVFSMDQSFRWSDCSGYVDDVDYFLFDTKGANPGGNARVFDWTLLKNYPFKVPFFLSGGLSIENLQGIDVLRDLPLHALDLNSGVESLPGEKDLDKVAAVVNWVDDWNINRNKT